MSSPRQLAKQRGEKWYMPDSSNPCKNGHVALRRVDNGRCSACRATIKLQNINPDMLITYENAKAMGFKTYWTGKPCRAGHTGWRYVSTRNCIDCVKENR